MKRKNNTDKRSTLKKLFYKSTLITMSSVLLLNAILFFTYEYFYHKKDLIKELRMIADIVGDNCAAPLIFNDKVSAENTLSFLNNISLVNSAVILRKDGTEFARFDTKGDPAREEIDLVIKGEKFSFRSFSINHEISYDSEIVGYIYIKGDINRFFNRMKVAILIAFLTIIAGIIFSSFLITKYQRKIILPVSQLSKLMKELSTSKDFTKNADTGYEGELGAMAATFNDLLSEIRKKDKIVINNQKLLESRIEERTRELTISHKNLENMIAMAHEAKEIAEAASEAKSQFVANISHEIRTPMHGIMGILDIISSTELTEKQAKHLETIKISTQNLLNIINDVLDFSTIEMGVIKLKPEQFDIKQTTKEISNIFEEQARERDVTFTLYFHGKIPSDIIGDQARFIQILNNLMSNAVKFTKEGSITITLQCVNETNKDAIFEIIVTDTGVGMSKEVRKNIFKPFFQMDDSNKREFGGTGLGLSIAKHLANIMGGEISFTSEPGKGSRFKFSIRFEKFSGNREDSGTGEFNPGIIAFSSKVLIVEDNIVNQDVAREMLEMLGVMVDVAGDGELGLEMALKNSYDIIFLDCQMPKKDGIEVTELIRKNESNAPGKNRVIIIAMSAIAFQQDRQKCFIAGMDDFLSKPFGFKDIIKMMEKWIPDKKIN